EQLVLVVDQFEELWTLVPDVAARDLFADLLAHAAGPQDVLRVVATLRADQYDLPLQHTTLGPVVSASTFAVTPMTAAELQDAIVVPAERVGVRFEPGLVSTMVGDVVSRPGALPLLQFTLTELFERRQNATVTTEAYEDLGGIGGALARRAEDLYEATAVEQRDDVHRLFTQLVTPGDDSDDLRRRATVEELADIAPRVVEEYRSNRLIVTDHHPVTREPTVEVAHEALLREWPRLAGWIDGDRDTIRVRRSLTLAAHDWQADPADESTLYRGTRLVAADQVARTLTVTGGERDFLAASHELADRDRRREADQLERTARANRRLRAQLVALAVVLVVAVVAGLTAVRQRDRAQESAADSDAAAVAADAAAVAADARRVGAQALVAEALDRSLLLAVEGVRLDDAPDTRANLLAALSRSPALVGSAGVGQQLWALDVSPDGELVAVSGVPGAVSFHDADTLEQSGTLDVPSWKIQFRPDGEQIAVAASSTTSEYPLPVLLVDSTTFEPERVQLGDQPPGGIAWDMNYSANGRYLAATFDLLRQGEDVSTATQIVVWDVTAPERPILSMQQPPTAETGSTTVALSPDGSLLYVGGGFSSSLTIYRVATREQVRSVGAYYGGRLAINPDGTLLAMSAGAGNEVALVDAATLVVRDRLRGHTQAVWGIRFSHDGDLLASASWDGTAIVWNLATGTGNRQEQLHGHTSPVFDLEFSPDDDTLYTGSLDQQLLAWDLDGERHLLRRRSVAEPVISDIPGFTLDYVPDSAPPGNAVAYVNVAQPDTAPQTGTVQWLDVTTGRAGEVVNTGHPAIGGHAWRPDGRRFATAGEDGFVRVWDWHTEALVTERQVAGTPLVGLDYTGDGTRLVVGEQVGGGGRLVTLDAATLEGAGPAVPFDQWIVSVAA
ncbi:MAG: hypothetical protein ABWZ76_05115, partial [Acidimicrobiales bacterium]